MTECSQHRPELNLCFVSEGSHWSSGGSRRYLYQRTLGFPIVECGGGLQPDAWRNERVDCIRIDFANILASCSSVCSRGHTPIAVNLMLSTMTPRSPTCLPNTDHRNVSPRTQHLRRDCRIARIRDSAS